jgi:hypothetical protein
LIREDDISATEDCELSGRPQFGHGSITYVFHLNTARHGMVQVNLRRNAWKRIQHFISCWLPGRRTAGSENHSPNSH